MGFHPMGYMALLALQPANISFPTPGLDYKWVEEVRSGHAQLTELPPASERSCQAAQPQQPKPSAPACSGYENLPGTSERRIGDAMTTATTDINQSDPRARNTQFQRWMFRWPMLGITMPGQVFGVTHH